MKSASHFPTVANGRNEVTQSVIYRNQKDVAVSEGSHKVRKIVTDGFHSVAIGDGRIFEASQKPETRPYID